jgi:site-specific DNA recombinase
MLASARWSGQIEPTTPEPATLTQIANHITEIITSGTHNQTKALVEALIAKVTITAPDRLTPIFRIPQADHHNQPATTEPPGTTTPTAAVRTMTKSVELTGLEPVTPALPVRCATSCATAPMGSPRTGPRCVGHPTRGPR